LKDALASWTTGDVLDNMVESVADGDERRNESVWNKAGCLGTIGCKLRVLEIKV